VIAVDVGRLALRCRLPLHDSCWQNAESWLLNRWHLEWETCLQTNYLHSIQRCVPFRPCQRLAGCKLHFMTRMGAQSPSVDKMTRYHHYQMMKKRQKKYYKISWTRVTWKTNVFLNSALFESVVVSQEDSISTPLCLKFFVNYSPSHHYLYTNRCILRFFLIEIRTDDRPSVYTLQSCHSSVHRIAGMTGNVLIDTNGDRICTYTVWTFGPDQQQFYRYMQIDLTKQNVPGSQVSRIVKLTL
jgi:hypothetical protein